MKIGVFLLLSASVLAAQAPAPGMEIRGTVRESGTNHPISDATVTVRLMGPRVIGQPLRTNEIAKLTTGAQGEFVYAPAEPGEYVFMTVKDGFVPVSRLFPGAPPTTQKNVVVTAEAPRHEIEVLMGRNATITGRFVDADTGEPITGVTFGVVTYVVQNGRRQIFPAGGAAKLDNEGRFSASVPPGPYFIEVRPQFVFKERLMTTFTQEDAAKTDLDFRRRYFPGGADFASALPVIVQSGGFVDVGTMRVRKEPFYRIRVSVSGACGPGQTVNLSETMAYEGSRWSNSFGDVPCGGEVLLRNTEPGNYILQARAGRTPADLLTAATPLVVTESNLNAAITLARGPDLVGRLVSAQGASGIPFDKIDVMLRPMDTITFASDAQPVRSDAQGTFKKENLQTGRKQLSVSGLGEGYYVKQVRYNGAAAPGSIFNFTGDGALEIEIDSQPASLSGKVLERDAGVSGADVILIRWPMVPADDLGLARHIAANGSGEFRAPGLAPGEYRIFAIKQEAREQAEEPAAWQRLVAAAEKVIVSRGAAQTLNLKLTEIR